MKERNIKVQYFKKYPIVKKSHSNLFKNANEIVLPFFKKRDRKDFQTFPTPDLNYIYLYLKDRLLNENGNWSIELAVDLIDKNDIYFYYFSSRLIEFSNVWHTRKKEKSGKDLMNFAKRLHKKNYGKSEKITLKDNVEIKQFFDDIKELRNNYLNCNNDQLLELFFSVNKIEIDYSDSYIRQMFYN